MALRTVFCVITYGKKARKLEKGPLRQYGSEPDAVAAAEELARRVAGVVAFSVRGDPTFDFWEEPVVIKTWGEVPAAEAA